MEVEMAHPTPLSREEWRQEMRKSFCKKDMIDEDGNLVKEYVKQLSITAQIFPFKETESMDPGRGKPAHQGYRGIRSWRMGANPERLSARLGRGDSDYWLLIPRWLRIFG